MSKYILFELNLLVFVAVINNKEVQRKMEAINICKYGPFSSFFFLSPLALCGFVLLAFGAIACQNYWVLVSKTCLQLGNQVFQ